MSALLAEDQERPLGRKGREERRREERRGEERGLSPLRGKRSQRRGREEERGKVHGNRDCISPGPGKGAACQRLTRGAQHTPTPSRPLINEAAGLPQAAAPLNRRPGFRQFQRVGLGHEGRMYNVDGRAAVGMGVGERGRVLSLLAEKKEKIQPCTPLPTPTP